MRGPAVLEIDTDRCEIPRCRTEADITYLSHGVCSKHWNELTNENAPPGALRIALGIEAEPDPLIEEMTMSKKTEKKTTEAKAAKKKEPKVREELCVFALRLTPQERDALHKMAGPARASRFARTVLVAAAHGDEAAIKTAIKEALDAAQ